MVKVTHTHIYTQIAHHIHSHIHIYKAINVKNACIVKFIRNHIVNKIIVRLAVDYVIKPIYTVFHIEVDEIHCFFRM